jgi:hypothetical protein
MRRIGERIRHLYEHVASGFERTVSLAERRYTPLGRFTPGPFEGWGFLWQPALLGMLATSLILAGCSFTNSPFKLDMANTWFYGEPNQNPVGTPSETKYLLAIVLTYGGLLLLMRVWLRLAEVVKLHGRAPLKSLWWMLVLWATPMIVAPPLFSRDIFSYAAQGEMTSHGLSPYILGPFSLGSSPYVNPVDPLWGNTPAPYGPFFLFLDGSMAKLTHHHQIWTVVGLRLLATVAVAAMGWGVSRLAMALGRDRGEAFVLAALNPLTLLTLIGGAHNDAIMAALLVIGISFAVQRRPYWAITFASLAVAVKAPAALGVGFIAWTWRGPGVRWQQKVRPIITSLLMMGVILGLSSELAGFGFGWVRNLLSNGTVRSWAAPATGIGLALSNLLHAVGINASTTSVLSVTRGVGLLTAMALTLWLLFTGERRGWVRSLGVALILFVELGPVVQPWYLVWGIVLLAASYKGREHFWILLLSITGPFVGIPGGRELLSGLVHANPLLIAVAVALLGGVLVAPMGRWTQWSWPEGRATADLAEA